MKVTATLKSAFIIGVVFLILLCLVIPAMGAFPTKQEVMDSMILVNDYWIDNNSYGDNEWARATYYEGNMAMYDVYPDPKYYDYALGWAVSHNWELQGGDGTRNADNQCAGQTYLDLYEYAPAPYKIEHIQASIDNMVNSTEKTDWWWIDALQMAMPVFTRFGAMYDETDYYDKMWDLYEHTKYQHGTNGLYSDNGTTNYGDYLWWRDHSFDPPEPSPNGNMVYWSRGNGWVIAAHVRTLQHLPNTDSHYSEYLQTFQDMAASLKDRQQADGFWYVNLDDPNHNAKDSDKDDGPETSGTGFFTYAIAWGINNDLFLDDSTYRLVVENAWNGMVENAVDAYGKLGYCQGVGFSPESGQPIGIDDTKDFCVGAFLLAGSEVVKMANGSMPTPDVWYSAADWSAIFDLGTGNTGVVTTEFDLTPLVDNCDGVVGYVDTDTTPAAWGDLPIIVRVYPNDGSSDPPVGPRFEVRNGDVYGADVNVPYNANMTYHVKMVTNLYTQRYDVWITPPNGPETQIADDYAFRTGAPVPDDLGRVLLRSVDDQFKIENHTVYGPWYSMSDYSAVFDLGTDNTGYREVEFDVTPLFDAIDGVIGYADSSITISAYSDMAMLIRMFTDGEFDVRNGNDYTADAAVAYNANNTYHVRMVTDLDAKTYSVWITPPDGSETRIANDYAFRSNAPQTDDLGKVCLKGYPPEADREFKVENHTVNPTCGHDYDYDFDVDGEDLWEFINNFDLANLAGFAAEFGNFCP